MTGGTHEQGDVVAHKLPMWRAWQQRAGEAGNANGPSDRVVEGAAAGAPDGNGVESGLSVNLVDAAGVALVDGGAAAADEGLSSLEIRICIRIIRKATGRLKVIEGSR